MPTFVAITSICVKLQHCNLAYNAHHGIVHPPRYSFCPVVICTYGYEGSLVEEMMTILFMFTASLTNARDMHTVGVTKMKQRFSNSP